MKWIAWILILAALGYLVYTLAFKPVTGELGAVRDLEREFTRSAERYLASLRQAGEPGMVVLADLEFAEKKVKDVRQQVIELMKNLKDPKAIARCWTLENKILEFCKRNQID
jgi:hypothetical protein